MGEIAIRADGLGKLYRIGRREKYRTLRESLVTAAAAPFRAFGRAGRRDDAFQKSPPQQDAARLKVVQSTARMSRTSIALRRIQELLAPPRGRAGSAMIEIKLTDRISREQGTGCLLDS